MIKSEQAVNWQWVFTWALGSGLILSAVPAIVIYSSSLSSMDYERGDEFSWSMIAVGLLAALTAVLIGPALLGWVQQALLRRCIPQLKGWVAATYLGSFLGLIGVAVCGGFLTETEAITVYQVTWLRILQAVGLHGALLSEIIYGPYVTGSCLALGAGLLLTVFFYGLRLMQWRRLRSHTSHANRWLLSSSLIGFVGGILWLSAYNLISPWVADDTPIILLTGALSLVFIEAFNAFILARSLQCPHLRHKPASQT